MPIWIFDTTFFIHLRRWQLDLKLHVLHSNSLCDQSRQYCSSCRFSWQGNEQWWMQILKWTGSWLKIEIRVSLKIRNYIFRTIFILYLWFSSYDKIKWFEWTEVLWTRKNNNETQFIRKRYGTLKSYNFIAVAIRDSITNFDCGASLWIFINEHFSMWRFHMQFVIFSQGHYCNKF